MTLSGLLTLMGKLSYLPLIKEVYVYEASVGDYHIHSGALAFDQLYSTQTHLGLNRRRRPC